MFDTRYSPSSSNFAAGRSTLPVRWLRRLGVSALPAWLLFGFAGYGATATPTGLACTQSTLTGAATDSCTVTLSAKAPRGGTTVTLASSNSAVSVPSAVTVARGASTATFAATAAAVTTAQTASLTATAGGASSGTSLQLNAWVANLSLSVSQIQFGNVVLNTTASEAVVVTSSGTAPLTIGAATPMGTGFSMSGPALPLTLNAGQTATLTVTFDPVSAGAVMGLLSISSNATSGENRAVILKGAGETPTGLSSVSCGSSSLTGAATDACTVRLFTAAGSGGQAVSLVSNNSAVSVPAAVTVASGATTAAFTATASAVTTAQTAAITASAGGASVSTSLQLNAWVAALSVNASSLSFGNVELNTPETESVVLTSSGTAPVTITGSTLAGPGFSLSGIALPLTLTAGQTATLTVAFDPSTAGAAAGTLTISSNATSGGTATVSLKGTGEAPPTLSSVQCSSNSLTGAATDACTVTLTSAATAATTVTLASSNSAVSVPATVTIASGSSTAAFTATATVVTTAQTASITAAWGGVSAGASLQLNAWVATLTMNSSSVAFGDVDVNTAATQSVVLTSSGTAPVTVSAATVTGAGFSMSGTSFPLTLAAGTTATLELTFDPTSAQASSGTVALSSNCSMGAMTVSLSGTGVSTSYSVDLTWAAPASSADPVAGYDVYRSANGGVYELLNASMETLTSYSDNSVASGTTYTYYVTSVDAEGNQSAPSGTYTGVIP